MTNNPYALLYALKEKMMTNYEKYKNENKDNSILICGYQDCLIEFLELLDNVAKGIEDDKKDNK